ncbi:MAG: D-alanyl-D-alanine carboxypeptidase/D-alanyl-D-alanine-endopeptidase [Opitutae bacterium]|nr:D-alanyl-D-alanine carboxypeptidase/D-alanyl-D-alanine-endopeptidase [Opitutae bacterium]
MSKLPLSRRAFFAFALLLAGAPLFSATKAPPAPVEPAATSVAELRAQVETLVNAPRFAGALWGVKVVSLDSGRTLVEHHADRLLSPASNCKLFSGALALDRLGGDYRIVTPILATAKPDAAGLVAGNVVVSGRGDPTWTSRRPKQDFWSAFEPFVAALQKAGVRSIAGDLVADATWLRQTPHGAGWAADDLNDSYGAELSAVTLDDNYADLNVTPAATAGGPCTLALAQPLTGLVLENRTQTVAAEGARRISALRLPGENTVYVYGTLPVGGKPDVVELPVPRPAQWFAAGLKEALARRGIAVAGRAYGVRWPEAPVAGATVRLGEVTSPPLREIVTGFMKPSQNLWTDLIFAQVGEWARPAEASAWRTTDACALVALQAFLREHGIPTEAVRFEEGSGLSRNNLTTAAAIVALLQTMAKHRAAGDFAASLPIGGVDGTLRNRLKGPPTEGNVRAKTGTLRWASALSGYLTTAAGERLAFSLMLNRHVATPERSARAEIDAIVQMLARCTGKSAPAEAGAHE